MASSTNIASIIDHAGVAYAYTSRSSKITRYTHSPNGSSGQSTINMDNEDITKEIGISVVLTPAYPEKPEGHRVIFSAKDNGKLTAFVDNNKVKQQKLGIDVMKDFNSMGAASLLGGAMTACFNDDGRIEIAIWSWDGLLKGDAKAIISKRESAAELGLGQVQAFSGSQKNDRNGSSVALTPFIDAEGVTRVFMVSTWVDSKKAIHVFGHTIEVTPTSEGEVVSYTNMKIKRAGLDLVADKFANCPSVMQRPDGRLMVWYCDNKGIKQSLVTPTSDLDWINNWQDIKGAGDIPAFRKYDFPCTISFVPGSVKTSKSSVAYLLDNATVPVFDTLFVQKGDDIKCVPNNNIWGTLRRTAQKPQPQQEVLALGLIDGPPPVPMQNINMPESYSNTDTNGIVSFSQGTGSSSGMSANLGASLLGRYGNSVGYSNSIAVLGFTLGSVEAKAQAEASLGASLMGAWSKSTTESVATTIQSTVNLAGVPNDYTVQPNGQIIGLSTQWASYIYDFVNASGKASEDGLSFVAVFPYQPSLQLIPFTIPANTKGAYPGNLPSYQRSQSQLNELDSKARMVGGRPYLEVSWSVGGMSSQQAENYDESDWSVNLGLDFGVLLGVEASLDIMGAKAGVSASAELKANFGYAWTQGSTNTAQFSSSVSLPGNLSARGTYRAYSYRTYLLSESANNLSILPEKIPGVKVAPGSKPWLINYAVTSSSMV